MTQPTMRPLVCILLFLVGPSAFAESEPPLSADELKTRIVAQHLPCDTVLDVSTMDADAAYVVTCQVAKMRDSQSGGVLGYALYPNGQVKIGRAVINDRAVILKKPEPDTTHYDFSACTGDPLSPALCDSTAKILLKHLADTGHRCVHLLQLMQLAKLQFTVAKCSNLAAGMMYEIRPTEVTLVDFNTMRIDLLYAGAR